MKKAVLKTILRDFFKLKYPLAMILVIVVLGAGLVWAGGALNTQLGGYRSNHNMPGMPATASTTSGARAVIIGNTAASSDYFVPTRTPKEWNAFLAHCPAGVTVKPVGSPGYYYDYGLQCTDAFVECPFNYYCPGDGERYPCPFGRISVSGSASASACRTPHLLCTPNPSCAGYAGHDCGTDDCGNACGSVCSLDYYCDINHFCHPEHSPTEKCRSPEGDWVACPNNP